QDEIDDVTSLLNPRCMQARASATLKLCQRLNHRCTLHIIEMQDFSNDVGSEALRKNSYRLSTTARLLTESFDNSAIIGRFERDKFILLQLHADEKKTTVAKWKLESVIRAHNQHATHSLEIACRFGTAHTHPEQDYSFSDLVEKAV